LAFYNNGIEEKYLERYPGNDFVDLVGEIIMAILAVVDIAI
jgi:hypothetical protein